jgi:hypothetical protein
VAGQLARNDDNDPPPLKLPADRRGITHEGPDSTAIRLADEVLSPVITGGAATAMLYLSGGPAGLDRTRTKSSAS